MSIASNLLFLHGYVATPEALSAIAPTPPPAAVARDPEPVVEVRERAPETPAAVRVPWRPGPFMLVDALCGTTPPAQFRIA